MNPSKIVIACLLLVVIFFPAATFADPSNTNNVEFYTFNEFYAGAMITITDEAGVLATGKMPTLDYRAPFVLDIYRGEAELNLELARETKGATTIQVVSRNGRKVVFDCNGIEGRSIVGLAISSDPENYLVPHASCAYTQTIDYTWRRGYTPRPSEDHPLP